MGDILNGIENALWIILAGKHGNGDRAANVGRMESRMDRIVACHDSADRDRPGRRAGRAGIGHHSAGHDRRDSHQRIHMLGDRCDVGTFQLVLGIDQHRELETVGPHQCFDRLQGLQRDKDRIVIRAAGTHGVGGLQGILEPAPRSEAPGDQGVAVNGLRYSHGFASTNLPFLAAFRSFDEGPPVGDPSCHAFSAGFRRTSLVSRASKPCPSPA